MPQLRPSTAKKYINNLKYFFKIFFKFGIFLFFFFLSREGFITGPSKDNRWLVLKKTWTLQLGILTVHCLWSLSERVSRSVVSDSATPWTVARQAPLSMEFPRENTGMGSHSLLQRIFPIQGSNPGLLHCRQIFYCQSHQGSPVVFKILL